MEFYLGHLLPVIILDQRFVFMFMHTNKWGKMVEENRDSDIAGNLNCGFFLLSVTL